MRPASAWSRPTCKLPWLANVMVSDMDSDISDPVPMGQSAKVPKCPKTIQINLCLVHEFRVTMVMGVCFQARLGCSHQSRRLSQPARVTNFCGEEPAAGGGGRRRPSGPGLCFIIPYHRVLERVDGSLSDLGSFQCFTRQFHGDPTTSVGYRKMTALNERN